MPKLSMSLALMFFLLLGISNISAIRINEVEMNPAGTDAGNEWIELYNDGDISLEGYMIVNGDGKNISLNNTFNGYFVYTFTKQWLDNSNESVSLYNDSELIDKTGLLEDSRNDDNTYQFCASGWKFMTSTKGGENNCTEISEETQTTATQNETVEENSNSNNQEAEEEETHGTNTATTSNTGSQARKNPTTSKTVLETINLNSKDIKTDNDKESLKKNLALGGVISFCVLFGGLFFLKSIQRKKENEFR